MPTQFSTIVHTSVHSYVDGNQEFEGFVARPEHTDKPCPSVLIFHEWMGLGNNVKSVAETLAKLGYVAFAADIYGKGIRPKTVEDAGREYSKYFNDRHLLRARARLAYDALSTCSNVDMTKVAAIGFCFGGTTALELARTGVDLAAVVSFHGNLLNPFPEDSKKIKAKVLALHGYDDPLVTMDIISQFEKEMTASLVDWQVNHFGGATHSFTNPEAGSDPSTGFAYNPLVSRRAFIAMNALFDEVF